MIGALLLFNNRIEEFLIFFVICWFKCKTVKTSLKFWASQICTIKNKSRDHLPRLLQEDFRKRCDTTDYYTSFASQFPVLLNLAK